MSAKKKILYAVPGKGGKRIDFKKYAIEDDKDSTTEYYDEVIIPEGITHIGDEVFKNQKKLTKVTLPESLQSIGDSAFEGCTGLTSEIFPDSIEEIDDYVF